MFNIKEFIKDSKAQGEWNALYMILIVAIIAVVLIAKIKPLFKESVNVGSSQEGIQNTSN